MENDYPYYQEPPTAPASTAPPLNRQVIVDTYARLLHRTPTEADITTHMRNPGGYEGFLSTVSGSPEARSYTDLTQPRSNPWDAPNSSIYAPRIVQDGGNTFLTEHGNRRQLQPNEVAPATSYRDAFWGNNPTGFQPGVGPQINSAYAAPSGGSAQSTAATAPATPGALTRPSADLMGLYGGFDFNKDYDLDKSAKGTFFYASAAGANDLRWQKSETAGAWFDQYIRPAYEAKGYKVDEVKGDKAFVHTRENPAGTWIDWVERIDGENPRLAWQDQSYGGTSMAAPTMEARSDNPTRNVAMSSTPTYNPDGTVTLRISPDAYRKLASADPLTYASLTQRA